MLQVRSKGLVCAVTTGLLIHGADCQVELLGPAVTQQQDVVYLDSSLGYQCV